MTTEHRVAGIDTRIDASWVALAALFALTVALERATAAHILRGPWMIVAIAVGIPLLLLSILAHAVAQAFVARARGIEVRRITLRAFGATMRTRLGGATALDDALIGLAGPVASLVLGGALLIAHLVISDIAGRGVAEILGQVAMWNIAFAGLNMLPVFPLDGGRVLRAVLWAFTGSLLRATRIVGAWSLGAAAVAMGTGLGLLITGSPLAGLWALTLGWFLGHSMRATLLAMRERAMRRAQQRRIRHA